MGEVILIIEVFFHEVNTIEPRYPATTDPLIAEFRLQTLILGSFNSFSFIFYTLAISDKFVGPLKSVRAGFYGKTVRSLALEMTRRHMTGSKKLLWVWQITRKDIMANLI